MKKILSIIGVLSFAILTACEAQTGSAINDDQEFRLVADGDGDLDTKSVNPVIEDISELTVEAPNQTINTQMSDQGNNTAKAAVDESITTDVEDKPIQNDISSESDDLPENDEPEIELVSDRPTAKDVGPQKPVLETISSDEAMERLKKDGRISQVRINGGLNFQGDIGKNWVVEDSVISYSGSLYALNLYTSKKFTGSDNERPLFKNVEIVGAGVNGKRNSAGVYGGYAVIRNANIYASDDNLKPLDKLEVYNSWIHDNFYSPGAHVDAIHIRSGKGIIFAGNRIDAYIGYGSSLGGTTSGLLQTGTTNGEIEAKFIGNWFAGGHYTIRGSHSKDTHKVSYTFKDNKFMPRGTSVALGRTNLPSHKYGPITGDLGYFDDSNVWEDTNQAVKN